MNIDSISLAIFISIVFLVSMFFSFTRWIEKNIEEITKENWIKALVRGVAHATIGAGVGIVSLIAIQEYYPATSRLMGAGASVIIAIIVDSVIFGLENKAKR
jgi:cytochrome b subunit of formate dehydrogenase